MKKKLSKILESKGLITEGKNLDKKMQDFMDSYLDNAIQWDDKIGDVAAEIREFYNEMVLNAVEGDPKYVKAIFIRRNAKTAGDFNKGAKKQIEYFWKLLDDRQKEKFFNEYSVLFESITEASVISFEDDGVGITISDEANQSQMYFTKDDIKLIKKEISRNNNGFSINLENGEEVNFDGDILTIYDEEEEVEVHIPVSDFKVFEDAEEPEIEDTDSGEPTAAEETLIKGSDLSPEQVNEVLSKFVYRWTQENKDNVPEKLHLAIDPATDADWVKTHAFYFTEDGKLSSGKKFAEPEFLSESDNIDSVDTVKIYENSVAKRIQSNIGIKLKTVDRKIEDLEDIKEIWRELAKDIDNLGSLIDKTGMKIKWDHSQSTIKQVFTSLRFESTEDRDKFFKEIKKDRNLSSILIRLDYENDPKVLVIQWTYPDEWTIIGDPKKEYIYFKY